MASAFQIEQHADAAMDVAAVEADKWSETPEAILLIAAHKGAADAVYDRLDAMARDAAYDRLWEIRHAAILEAIPHGDYWFHHGEETLDRITTTVEQVLA